MKECRTRSRNEGSCQKGAYQLGKLGPEVTEAGRPAMLTASKSEL